MAAQDEDRHAVVVVAAPALGELERPPADDDRPGGQGLVHDLTVHARQVAASSLLGVAGLKQPTRAADALGHRARCPAPRSAPR